MIPHIRSSMSVPRLIRTASIALVAGLVIYATWRGIASQRNFDHSDAGATVHTQADLQGPSSDQSPNRSGQDSPLSDASTTENRQPAPVRFQLLSTSAKPVPDALVSWSRPSAEFVAACGNWPDLDWDSLERETQVARSDAQGWVAFDSIPHEPGASAAVLWITPTDHLARGLRLTSPSSNLDLPPSVELTPSGPLKVRVIGADGAHAVGATVVEHFDLSKADSAPSENTIDARRLLRRTATTDEKGQALLYPLDGASWIYATLGDRRSQVWKGSAPADVVLSLRQVFTAAGRVFLPSGTPLDAGLTVRCLVKSWLGFESIEILHVHGDASWGPVQLPLVDCEAFVFQLDGGSLTQENISVKPPSPTEQITVDFHPQPGVSLTVRVVDSQDSNLSQATVTAEWNEQQAWRSMDRKTGPDGVARFASCRPGMTWIRVRCPGYGPQLLDAFDVSAPPTQPIVVRLARAERITGRCVYKAHPVQSFYVTLWQGSANNSNKNDFQNTSDGSFVIEDAPIGDCTLIAISEEHPQTEPKNVTVTAGTTTDVLLEFSDAIAGRGRVVDALSNEPLSGATVETHIRYKDWMMRPWKAPFPVDSKGEFELKAFGAGTNFISVAAHGYATRRIMAFGASGKEIDFGLIGLFSQQSLEVRLRPQHGESTEGSRAELQGMAFVDEQAIPANGILRFDALDPGFYTLRVVLPDRSTLFDHFTLHPGKSLVIDVPLGSRHINVHIVPSSAQSLPENSWLRVCFSSSNGRPIEHYFRIPASNEVEITRVDGEDLVLEVSDPNDVVLGVQHQTLSVDGPSTIEVRLEDKPLEFRVIDISKSPVAAARVTLTLPSDRSGWLRDVETDGDGRCSATGNFPESLYVSVHHASLGLLPSTLVDVGPSARRPIEITLAPDLDLQALVFERQTPVPAIQAAAHDQRGLGFGLGETSSDASGLLRWRPVSKGDYRIDVRHPGYWPVDQDIHLTSDSPPIPIQVRRLGNVEIVVKNNYGNALDGAAIDLYSEEMKAWVSAWIQSGLVPSPASGMITSSEGCLRVNGLPNGEFRWRVTPPGGTAREGAFTVAPQTTTQQEIQVL